MALLAQQLPRRFNSVKLTSFIKAKQVTKRSARAGKAVLPGFSAQPLLSSDTSFLRRGIKTYRTLFWNRFHSASTNRTKSSAESTLLPSVAEQQERILSLESELPLEGNSGH
jgi:mTERF domain-containing protein